jgi:hypothetical protein
VDLAALPLPSLLRVRLARAEVQSRISAARLNADLSVEEIAAACQFFRQIVDIMLELPDDPKYLADDLKTTLLDQVIRELDALGIRSDVRPALCLLAGELEKKCLR